MIDRRYRSQTIEIGGNAMANLRSFAIGLVIDEPPPRRARCAKTGRFKAGDDRMPLRTSKFLRAPWAWLGSKQKTR